jgi:mono/diheme cytochrome c family protein
MHHGITSRLEKERDIDTVLQQKELYHQQADSETDGEIFYPETMAKSGAMSLVVFAIVLAFTLLVGPARLYDEANLTNYSFPVEEWWFWWYSALIAMLPSWLAPAFVVLFPLLLLLAMLALPFVDRGPKRGMRRRPLAVAIVAFCVMSLLGLSALRLRSGWTGWPSPVLPPVPEGVILSERAEQGRQLFASFGCNTCHSIGATGRTVAIDLAMVETPKSRQEYRRYILRPPLEIAMPPYEGRITEDELDALLDYVHAAQNFPRQISR